MKNVIAALMTLVLTSTAFAESMFDKMSPEELSQYEIVVVKKGSNKEVGRMSRSKYKVVKIEDDQKKQQAEAKALADAQDQGRSEGRTQGVAQGTKEEAQKHNNSIILHAGVGNNGLSVTDSGSQYHEVTEKKSAVGGFTYCRSLNQNGICATGMTNETFTLGYKRDF